jgi:hypothetical protein
MNASSRIWHGDGVRPAKGWSANAKTSEIYEVVFDFMNGKVEEQAIWFADLKTAW